VAWALANSSPTSRLGRARYRPLPTPVPSIFGTGRRLTSSSSVAQHRRLQRACILPISPNSRCHEVEIRIVSLKMSRCRCRGPTDPAAADIHRWYLPARACRRRRRRGPRTGWPGPGLIGANPACGVPPSSGLKFHVTALLTRITGDYARQPGCSNYVRRRRAARHLSRPSWALGGGQTRG